MKIRDLPQKWDNNTVGPRTATDYAVRLPLREAARLQALNELYPELGLEALITDLLSAAIEEREEALPYVQGERIVAEDELGDPIFNDAGPTPRYRELVDKHEALLRAELSQR
jgi:hypothetical protein